MIVAYWHSNVQSASPNNSVVVGLMYVMYYESMKKKLLILLVFVGLIIVSVVAVLFFVGRDTSFNDTTLAEIKKTLKDDSPTCLESSKTVSIPAKDEHGLQTAVVTAIIDVPAGTNVDVRVASMNATEATGSSKYDGNYGAYNYVAEKVAELSSNDQTPSIWKVTSFVACKS